MCRPKQLNKKLFLFPIIVAVIGVVIALTCVIILLLVGDRRFVTIFEGFGSGNVITGGSDDQYQIGVGIADVTGPAAEINMMGYAQLNQNTAGIHLRLFSRAVIVVDKNGNRICYVTADIQGVTQIVKIEVIRALQKKFPNLYMEENLLISATHTHSGPGGYFQYLLYLITSEGFIHDSFNAIVDGIVKSIDRAHRNLKLGYIYWNNGELLDSSVNRSPASYLNNPPEERQKYKHNTDKVMQILKFVDINGKPLGMINWHAVHATSMNNSNHLISSDNKGYASILSEKDHNNGQLIGMGPFVAIFSNANEGDASPNTAGPICIDTGKPCDFMTSTCNGKNELCIAFGPGKNMFESTEIIAKKQYQKAKELFDSATIKVSGPIEYIYQNIDMSNYQIQLNDSTVKTCKPALGFSFAAGTTDGEGAKWFHQGTHQGEVPPLWNTLKDFIHKPSEEMVKCHLPKAIILGIGEMDFPYKWASDLAPTQLFKIGNVVIAALPGEFTTMSGRRIRNAIVKEFASNGQTVNVALAGLSNSYSNYIATFEEYQIQRYEGGSTLYGPHTLDAYLQQYTYLASNMIKKKKVNSGPLFPNLLSKQITLKPGVIFDSSGFGHSFGDVLYDALSQYRTGENVRVVFVSAHPRNNLELESTFLTVEKLDTTVNQWKVIMTDSDWETKYEWKRTNAILGQSEATIEWIIPKDTPSGQYRIRHFGYHKDILGEKIQFSGTSRTFTNIITDSTDDQYQIGVGIADITGPAAEINMMGYATFGQDTAGIHLRLFSRAVIVVDKDGNRICYVNTDLLGISEIIKIKVIRLLTIKYGNIYRDENLLITAIHNHSGPGGYFQYFLYLTTSKGFIHESFNVIVNGIVKSIDRAHHNLKLGYIYWNYGELLDSSVNRSPAAYLNNPPEERQKYKHNTDKVMQILKFVDINGKPLGMINWHAVHATSMNHSNHLISSDNKGYASILFEKDYNNGQLIGTGPFVAIFSNSNEGDSSPNTAGPRCTNTGKPCDFVTSTCKGEGGSCIAFGPGKNMFKSTEIIAKKQYQKAKELFDSATIKVSGPIEYIYQNIDMSNYQIQLNGSTVKTCKSALGFSFAAGTTDGEGAKWFHQGTREGEESLMALLLRNIINKPSDETINCHKPKAIFLSIGEINFPYKWAPDLVPTQLLKIGNIVIAALPGEFTTMSGRRIRNAIVKEFASNGQTVNVALTGLSNSYSHYITTFEEYQIQRYEGGSTLYGPHTLDAYLQQYTYLASNMIKKKKVNSGPSFPNLLNKQITLKPGVKLDSPGFGHSFGDVLYDALSQYRTGENVRVVFVSAHPRNNLELESTFLTVEKLDTTVNQWKVIMTDANWETIFKWKRTDILHSHSKATIIWTIPKDTPAGRYRIKHFGWHKTISGHIKSFEGTSTIFKVI